MRLEATSVTSALEAAGITGAQVAEEGHLGLVVRLPIESARDALIALRDGQVPFEQLIDAFGADTGEGIEVTYRLRALTIKQDLTVKSQIEYGGTLPSVIDAYLAVLLPERELAEMFGLFLEGHPNPKRLLSLDVTPPLLLKSTPIRTREELWSE